MSWEAVTWANRQKLKKSYEQIVLLVLANTADPNGECFVKWPSRDHWWVYLSEKTRLPKSSLFRHLGTIVQLGLGTRSEIVMSDGSRRPTFKLNMETSFDIDLPEDEQRYITVTSRASTDSQSPRETGNADESGEDENESNISRVDVRQDDSIEPQSPVGTGNPPRQSPVGTEPVPVLRLHKDSISVPKDSPQPPSGGLSAVEDQGWKEFCAAWREPMPRHDLARAAWDHTPTDKRPEATAAARGYWSWHAAQRKPPTPVSAQTFLRDQVGWPQWLRYTPAHDGSPPLVVDQFDADSREGRAIAALYEIAGKGEFFRQVKCRGGKVYWGNPITPQLLALADSPPRDKWVRLTREQAASWESRLLGPMLPILRQRLGDGSSAPWHWPSKAGALSPASPGEDDPAILENENRQ